MHRGSLFEPDVVADARWGAHWGGGGSLSSEKRLMMAVLKSALISYQKYAFAESAHGRESFREAASWIALEEDDWFFSFDNICEHLGIVPDHLRNSLAIWYQRIEREGPAAQRALPKLSMSLDDSSQSDFEIE